MNPFNISDLNKEIEWMAVPVYDKDGVKTEYMDMQGVCPEYFNKQFWLGELTIPRLKIDGRTWMSLTPMEIQSAWVPLSLAEGRVGTGGCGMGYFAIAAAADDSVDEVLVYENDPRVIKFFNEVYEDREEFCKITVMEQDVRELKGEQFDMFFMDIYPAMLGEEVLTDMSRFKQDNCVSTYRYWGQERVFLHSLVEDGSLPDSATWADGMLFSMWTDEDRDATGRPANMYYELGDMEEFIKAECEEVA